MPVAEGCDGAYAELLHVVGEVVYEDVGSVIAAAFSQGGAAVHEGFSAEDKIGTQL